MRLLDCASQAPPPPPPPACWPTRVQEFYKLSGDKAAALLREWPPGRRRELLGSRQLAAPTELCLVEVRCGSG